jgi:hypothetical protein
LEQRCRSNVPKCPQFFFADHFPIFLFPLPKKKRWCDSGGDACQPGPTRHHCHCQYESVASSRFQRCALCGVRPLQFSAATAAAGRLGGKPALRVSSDSAATASGTAASAVCALTALCTPIAPNAAAGRLQFLLFHWGVLFGGEFKSRSRVLPATGSGCCASACDSEECSGTYAVGIS